jgi:hypothetical protein
VRFQATATDSTNALTQMDPAGPVHVAVSMSCVFMMISMRWAESARLKSWASSSPPWGSHRSRGRRSLRRDSAHAALQAPSISASRRARLPSAVCTRRTASARSAAEAGSCGVPGAEKVHRGGPAAASSKAAVQGPAAGSAH